MQQLSIEELLKETERFRYISIDLFDTLMCRAVSKPELIFYLVEREYNKRNSKRVWGFRKRRIKAEALARKKAHYKEVTIESIYAELDYSREICNKLECIEKFLEMSTCSANQVMVDFMNQCHMRGQKVVVTTDMYLDRDTIERILQRIGAEYDRLFISCESGKTKLSGELFEVVLHDLKIESNDICHIGDNQKTDIESPRRYGIQSFERLAHRNNIEPYLSKRNTLDTDILNTFVWNHLRTIADEHEKIQARIGYSVIGPLLFDFCSWLKKISQKEQANRIAFVAREGYLIKLVYDIICTEENASTEYVRLNKNMIRWPSLYKNPTVKQFEELIPYRDEYSGEELARLLFISPRFVTQLLLENEFPTGYVQKSDFKTLEFKTVFSKILEHEKSKLQEQFVFLVRYLNQIEAIDKKILFVNNSINGSTQRSIGRLVDNNIIGIQFTASQKCLQELDSSVRVWLEDIGATNYEKQMFAQYSIVLEHLMFENTGTAQYLYEEDNIVKVKYEIDGVEEKNAEIIQPIQKYALQFVRDWQEYGVPNIVEVGTGFHRYMEFLLNPKREDALLIGNIIDSDYDGIRKLFDVGENERLTYYEAKNYKKIKWQHGYYMTQESGKQLKELFDMEKRIKCMVKNFQVGRE